MIVRFNTHEEAGIYSSRMRAEGHYADVLDEGCGFLWGPMAIGGFRVVVTDDPIAEEAVGSSSPAPDTEIGRLIRMLVAGWAVIGTIAAMLLYTREDNFKDETMQGAHFLVMGLIGVLLIMPICLAMNGALRDKRSATGALIRTLVAVYIIGSLATGLMNLF